MMPAAKETDEQGFENDVLVASMQRPVVVDFWAPWCGPCRQLMPLLEKTVAATAGAVSLVKVNVDENPGLAQALRIQSVPTVYAFFQGRPVEGFAGAKTESEVRAFVAKLSSLGGDANDPAALPPEEKKKLMEEADAFFRDEKYEDAMARYAAVLDRAGDDVDALSGLGWCLMSLGDVESVRDMVSQIPPERGDNQRLKGLRFILEFSARVAPGDVAALGAAIAANPKNLQARFDLALQLLAFGDIQGGVDALLDLVQINRDWEEKKARLLLLEIFDALGPVHPLAARARRRLSSLLFS